MSAPADSDLRSRNLRRMAESAVGTYGLEGARLQLLEQKKNVTFRVEAADGSGYLLRLCRTDGFPPPVIESEAIWLHTLRHQAGLIVPEPVACANGTFVAEAPGVGGEPARPCLLLSWIPGHTLDASLSPALCEQLGELLGRLHRFSERFEAPPGFERPRFDCPRIFGDGEVIPPGRGESLVSDRQRSLLDEAARRARREIENLGEDPTLFGMIHTDPEPDNVVYHDGELYPIDFADCGWGYYLYDLAAALLPMGQKQQFPALREALLRGYRRLRPLPAELADHFDTFIIARSLFATRWMLLHGWASSKVQAYARTVVPHILAEVRRYLESRSGRGPAAAGAAPTAMLTTVQFLSHLRDLGITLRVEGERLRLRAPQGRLTRELQAELAERKAEILEFLRHAAAPAGAPPLTRSERLPEDGVPLSFAQQRLWFIDQLEPGSSAYNIPQSVRLEGALRIGVLERTLNEIIRRQACLRTSFTARGGEAVQRIAPALSLSLPVADLRRLAAAGREAEIRRLRLAEAARPFDLARAPLLRLVLLATGELEHHALFTMHHIISDGWSAGVFVRELLSLYAAFSRGQPSPLPELRLQYADFAHWQRQWLRGEVLEAQIDYWRLKLAGAPPVIELPTDRPRSPYEAARGARHDLTLPLSLSEGLKALGQERGATLFMTLLAAFKALLSRITGQDDIVVGSPIANRNRSEVEELIGFFVNTLVLRTALAGNPGFCELLERVRETTVGAYAHQDLPFEKLVEEVGPERSLSHSPLFQVAFTLQNAPMPELSVEDLTLSWLRSPAVVEKFDLTLSLQESLQGVEVSMRYKQELFDATTIRRWGEHFRILLAAAAADPGKRLAELPLLDPAQTHQLICEWNSRPSDVARDLCLHQLFEIQVERTPEAVALCCGDQQLSYRQLNRRANRLAHHLRTLGVGPEVQVGICAERRSELPVALMATLKAGGAYVPLDPSYPAKRIAFMLADADVGAVVVHEELLARLPALEVPMVCLGRSAALGGRSPENPPPAARPRNLAYTIYTSGSTGRPKGVAIAHHSAVAMVEWAREVFTGGELAGVLASTSICFDLSVFELFVPLSWGGTAILVRDALELGSLPAAAAVRMINTVPSAAAELVRQQAIPPTAGTINLAGEPLRRTLVEALYRTATVQRVFNLYGPSEDTTYTTFARIDPEAGPPTIGVPVSGTRAHVLDRRGQPVAIGVVGELCVGGEGLARGYLGRPRRTAVSFVPNPFRDRPEGRAPGSRLYRTGDLVRRLPDGELAFLGRIDHQVKVRGFRIELGEIEAALAGCRGVREAVVVVREDAPGDRRLVAYLVATAEPEPPLRELRRELEKTLPGHMVPSAFVWLEALPLTPNGKVNRRALPAPEAAGPEEAGTIVFPAGPTEEILAGIWADVLRRERVGSDGNFFELGGHSLLGTQVVSRVREAFGVELPLRALFKMPTVAELARGVESLKRRGTSPAAPPLCAVPRDRTLVLSFAQQRLWFLEQLELTGAAYSMPVAVRLEGKLVPGLLERALGEVVRRHEILRTTFVAVGGEPRQRIAARLELPLAEVDLEALPAAAREPAARRLAAEEMQRRFDLARGPLIRTTLLRLAAHRHVLLLSMHHIVSDGWSIGVLLHELTALYDASSRARPAPLGELPIQYADFAHWQRQWLRGEVLEAELAHWRERLAGAVPSLELPTDRPYPAVQTFRGGAHRVVLPPPLADALAAWSRQQGVTLYMTLLAGFDALLGRYGAEQEVVVGSPIAGRNRREIEGLIGFFVNTLVIRTDLGGDPSFRELVARVREGALEAYAHQDLPFERLVEDLAPERDLSRDPIFQVVFGLQNAPRRAFALPELEIRPFAVGGDTTKFDLTLLLEQDEATLSGSLEYRTDLFDATTAARLAVHFSRLLADALEHPGRGLSELCLLSAAQRHQAVAEWNDTRSGEAVEEPVHRLVEAWAHRRPDAPAVVAGGRALSYGELNARANQLAHRLRALGVGPEVRAAVSLERSPEEIVALLAILKAGGAYLPLDPAYPAKRRAFMLEDAGVRVLLATAAAGGLPEMPRCHLLSLDREAPAIAAESRDNLAGGATGADLAYVIYTSGSTGKPKGVAIEHRSLLRLIAWHREAFRVSSRDRATRLSGLAFDASVWELWPYLAAGAAVHVPDEETRSSPARLRDWLIRERLTLGFVPTPVTEGLLALDWPASSALRAVLTGGDTLHRHPPAELPFAVVNNYGPTESTVVATSGTVPAGGWAERLPSLGRPIADVRVYVLDRHLQPVGAGVPGELCIGGSNLARGYLGRPGRTAGQFVPDPFAAEPGLRAYRTGDLVRYRPGGEIDFLGRIDHQIKLRGFRIELGEIATVLGTHRAVRDCVAVLRRDDPGEPRLVAYVVPQPGASPETGELRGFCHEVLPSFMVPAAFVLLEALPLTPNGKVDRRALPAPEPAGFQGPGTVTDDPTAELLAGIWAEVLGCERVGVDDDFFELGGHSLLATRLQSRVRRVLGVELPLRVVFEQPTLAGQAAWIGAALRRKEGLEAPPLRRVTPRDRLPLSFAQQRLWFLDQLEPGSAVYNIPTSLALTGDLRARALSRALSEIVRRHEVLRTRFSTAEEEPVQEILPEIELPLPVVDLRALVESQRRVEARRRASTAGRRPFDLARGPLLRAALLRLGGEEHTLVLAVHHVAFDGWSAGVFLNELSVLYRAFSAGKPSPLPELPVQYADFAMWQRQWLRGEVLERQLGYWREQLAGVPVLDLSCDRPRPAVQSFRGGSESFLLPAQLHGRLRALGRERGTTLFMTLLAAFQTLLGRWAGEVDLAVGSAVAGRNQAELEGLVGFFVNTLALRGDLSGNPSFGELLARVREAALGAYAHQDVPFEQLVEALDPERNLSQNPLVQVLFLLQNAPAGGRPPDFGPELAVGIEAVATGEAKFDLTLGLEEGEEGLRGALEYNVDLFDRTTILRMLKDFRAVVGSAVVDPERRLSQWSPLDRVERQQLLVEWNDTVFQATGEGSIPALFEAQEAATPEAIAVVGGGFAQAGEQLSYRELNRRANRLAHHLRLLGVGPEATVGICTERTPEMVVAILAVLKAGGAYVPLDPDYPQERLAFMLEDAGAGVLLTQERLLAALPEHPAQLVCLDADRRAIADHSAAAPPPAAGAGNLAYVIYTSGSTGRPKGVALTHSSVVAMVRWAQTVFSAAELARVLAATSICFDLSVFELFVSLSRGGTVVLAASALDLPELAAAGTVTLVNTVPSAMRELVRLAGLPASVRTVNLAGEALPRELVDEVYRQGIVERVFNLYGPSEDTTYSTFACVARDPAAPPIGRPVADTRFYLLDRRGQPVPLGVPGELYLGGEGLARGYLDRPDLTAERFLPDPFDGDVGGRLYRTGDLVRTLPDGELAFLGRLDHQVKLRGFRIELGEVETLLGAQPGVRECAVVVREERLVAFVVRDSEGPETETGRLRDRLRESLPEYMVPSVMVLLEALPLTPNRKVDRQALLRLSAAARPAGTGAPPRDPVEEILVEIYSQLLGVERVGVDDDFFELGGHSLMAVRLMARIAHRFGRKLPLATLFQGATVEHLAARLRRGESPEPGRALVEIRPAGSGRPLFLVHPIGGSALCYLELSRHLGPERPLYGLQVPESDARGERPATLEQLASRHLEAIREVRPAGPYVLGGWSMGGVVAFEMARQLAARGEKVDLLVLIDAFVARRGDASQPLDQGIAVGLFARDLAGLRGQRFPLSPESFRGLDEVTALEKVLAQAREQALLPPEIGWSDLCDLFAIYEANGRALERYVPQPWEGSAVLFRATEGSAPDPAPTWQRLVSGELAVDDLPGSHYTIMTSPAVRALGKRLEKRLQELEDRERDRTSAEGDWKESLE